MKNKQLKKIIEKLVENTFSDGKIIEQKSIKAVKALKTLPRAESIYALSEYVAGLKRKERQHTMFVETTFALSPAQLNKMKEIINKKVKITRVVTKINPEIIGGFILKVGDEIWDQSILEKINQVKEVIVRGRSN